MEMHEFIGLVPLGTMNGRHEVSIGFDRSWDLEDVHCVPPIEGLDGAKQ